MLTTNAISFVLFVSVAVRCVTGQEADILIHPNSVNISLNEVAEFNCTAVTTSFVWKANGMSTIDGVSPITVVDESQSIRMSTLRVPVSSVDDATNITCTAIKNSPLSSDESAPALLQVQGRLDPVSNLTVTLNNSTTLLISWSPPFTLEGVPILSYNVIITNSSNNNETFSVAGSATMWYHLIDISANIYVVSVVPVNFRGAGMTATYIFRDIMSTATSQVTVSTSSGRVSESEALSVTVMPSLSPAAKNDQLGAIIGGTIPVAIIVLAVIVFLGILFIYVICRHNVEATPKLTRRVVKNTSTLSVEETDFTQVNPPVSDPSVNPPVSDPSVNLPVSDPSVNLPVSDPSVNLPVSDPSVNLPVSVDPPVFDKQVKPPTKSNIPEEEGVYLTEFAAARERFPVLAAFESSDLIIPRNNINFKNRLGIGFFGKVCKAQLKNSGIVFAVKTCEPSHSDAAKRQFLYEADIVRQFDHPNIAKLVGVVAISPFCIVMEHVGYTLHYTLRSNRRKYGDDKLIKMCKQVCDGMAYLERNNYVHRALSARNCLISDSMVVKISNFGMRFEDVDLDPSDPNLRPMPIKWTAPEALKNDQYTSASDVWSFGVLIWETFSFGNKPYPGIAEDCEEKVKVIEKLEEAEYMMEPPENCPQAVYDLMMQCWERDPGNRPKFDKILTELVDNFI